MRKFFCLLPVLILLLAGCDDSPTTQFPPGKGPPDSAGPIKVATITEGISFKPEEPTEPRTDELGRQLIGTYFDTTFGEVTAKAFFNFNLPINSDFSDSFLDQRSIDSAILKMPLGGGKFGDFSTVQTINFHRIDETIQESQTYGSDAEVKLINDPVGQWRDSLEPNTTMRVKLNDNFLDFFRGASVAQLTNNQNFTNFFKGLAAIPQDDFNVNRQGGIGFLRLLGRATIVFHQANGVRDSIVVDQRAARFNTYSYNRDDAFVTVGEPGKQFGFLQPPSGLKTTLTLDPNNPNGISRLLDSGKVSIHKADIILPVSQQYHAEEPPPSVLEVWADDDGEQALQDTTKFNQARQYYRINKVRYVQEILTAKADNRKARFGKLNFRVPFNPPQANTGLLQGANNPGSKGVRLEVTFSKIQQR